MTSAIASSSFSSSFYCGLQKWSRDDGWNKAHSPSLCLAGYLKVEAAGMTTDFSTDDLQSMFGNNFHVRYPSVFERQKNDLVVVKGGTGSRLLTKAHQINTIGKDRSGKPLKVLSPAMQEIFGDFGKKISIQRRPPRWVDSQFVDKAIDWVVGLE